MALASDNDNSWKNQQIETAQQGWIFKKGVGPFGSWKRRYLKLTTDKSLEYYTNESFSQMKGSINLDNIPSQNVKIADKGYNDIYKWGFIINDGKRKWLFAVKTKIDLDEWINNLKNVINGKYFERKNEKIEKENKKNLLKQQNKYGYTKNRNRLKNRMKKTQNNDNNMNNNNNINAYNDNDEDINAFTGGHLGAYENDNRNNPFNTEKIDDNMYGIDNYGKMDPQQKMDQLQQRSNNALDMALMTTAETEDIAFDTAAQLDSQRNQLQKIDKNLHEIDQDLDQTNTTLKGMKSIKQAFLNKFKKPQKKKEYQAPIPTKSVIARDDKKGGLIQVNKQQQIHKKNGKMQDEEDEKLDEILQGIRRIQAVTNDVNKELEEQDILLDAIDDKMNRVSDKLQYQNKTMNGIK